MKASGDETHRNDRPILGRTQMKADPLTLWEGYNDYDDVSNESCGHRIKTTTLV